MHVRLVPARRWMALAGFLTALLALSAAEARVTLNGANGTAFDLDDAGTGALVVPGAFNGFPELCVRVCDACANPCGIGDIYDARGVASSSELQGLQRSLAPAVVNGLQVVRKVYVPSNNPANANGFVRYLDIVSNLGAAPVTLSVRIGTSGATGGRLGQGPGVSVWRSQDDDAEAEPADRWILTDDDNAAGGSASVSHLVHGAGARVRPALLGLSHPMPDPAALAWDYHNVVVAPGDTVIFMTLLVVEPQRDNAIIEVQNLLGMTSEVLFGLTNPERTKIANFDIEPGNPSPVADAGGPYNANEGEQVQLSAARSVDPVDNQQLVYEWDLDGDGDFDDSLGANTIVSFPDDGVYSLDVRVTDPQGKRDVDSARIVVRNVAPRVEAVTTDSPIDEGGLLTVEVQTLEPGQDQLTFDFDWEGDGRYDDVGGRQSRATHQYFTDGNFTARVRVTDDDGGQTEFDFPVVVNNLPPTLFEIVGNWPQLEGAEVSIQIIAQDPGNDRVTIGYDLDHDGTYELEGEDLDETTYTWDDNGQYTISIRLTDDQGASTVVEELIPILNANPALQGVSNTGPVAEGSPVDLIVTATDTPADTLAYSFDLDGDGTFDDDVLDQAASQYTHIYRQQGLYIVGVRVRDEDNGRALGNTAVEVVNAPPVGTITAPEYVDEGERFEVSVEATDPGDDIVLFDWDVTGDGVYDVVDTVDTNQMLVLNREGDAIITVRAHDRDGGETLLNAVVHVRHVEPQVELSADEPLREGRDIPFHCVAVAGGGGDVLSYAFDFDGDGGFEIEGLGEGDATHVYDDQGIYTATCAVDDGSSVVFANTLVIVENAPPVVSLRSDSPADEGRMVHLTATVNDPSPTDTVTLAWDLDGDGLVDVQGEPDLERDIPAVDDARFTVTLIATDEDGGESQAQAEVVVRNVPPQFEDIAFLPRAREGEEWTYVVPVTDPAGPNDPLVFELLNPPVGVSIDAMSGFISWVPTYDQYRASPVHIGVAVRDGDDGRDETELVVEVDFRDADVDGLPDSWEVVTCNAENVCLNPNDPGDADDDPDEDGRTNAEEWATGDDPFHYDGPPQPANLLPENGIRVDVPTPFLEIDPKDGDGNPDTLFTFEIYQDEGLTQLVLSSDAVARGQGQTVRWSPPEGIFIEDSTYWWRARAVLEPARSPWTEAWSFTVNAVNYPPSQPRLRAPLDGEQIPMKFPTFQAEPCTDDDGDDIHYLVHLYNSRGDIELNGAGEISEESGLVEFRPLQELTENATYTWNVVAIDELGAESMPSETWSFTINTENSGPDTPFFIAPEEDEVVTTLRPELKAGGTRDLDSATVHMVFRLRHSTPEGMLTDEEPLVESEPVLVNAEGEAAWTPPLDLEEDEHYLAEAWATDGLANSEIVQRHFNVSVTNSPPATPNLRSPLDQSKVSRNDLFLDWDEVTDPEGGLVKYVVTTCELLDNNQERCSEFPGLVDSGMAFEGAVAGSTYRWHVVAVDPEGNESEPTTDWTFVVDDLGGGGGNTGDAADGCGCRSAGAPGTAGSASLLLLAGLVLRRARRRSGSPRH